MPRKDGSWSGSGSFTYSIERFLDNQTGNYLTEPELPENFDEERYEYTSVELTVTGSGYYTPARLYGPPEDCYPSDGELEIESIIGPDDKEWSLLITELEKDSIEIEFQDYLESHSGYSSSDYGPPDPPDLPDYYDYYY